MLLSQSAHCSKAQQINGLAWQRTALSTGFSTVSVEAFGGRFAVAERRGVLKKERLFTPGPTPLSPRVREALSRPTPHHRSDEFRRIFRECRAGLQRFLKSSEDALILSCSGSGGMEAAVVNTVAPGETLLALVAGHFGQRWVEIGKAHGRDVRVIEAAWGEAVAPEDVARTLDREPAIRAVCVQYSESSTGIRHDVEALGRIVRERPGTVLVVDAISGAGAMPLETEAWGIDLVVVGSQKALSLPPGLAFVAVSAKAWARIESCSSPRFYFDLRRERKGQAEGNSAFTPGIAHVVALRAALQGVEDMGGVDALVANAGTLAAMTRAAATPLGLPLLSPHHAGDALTALLPPPGLEAGAIVGALKARFAATVAGGQGRLSGKILRIAHLGHYDAIDILGLIGALEIVLAGLGHRFAAGAGMAAAQAAYAERDAHDAFRG